jgi:hypothetical protein
MVWKTKVKIKHLFTKKEDPKSVRKSMAEIADVLDKSPAFSQFSTKKFRAIPKGDSVITPLDYANKLLEQMYDYADQHRIWIE